MSAPRSTGPGTVGTGVTIAFTAMPDVSNKKIEKPDRVWRNSAPGGERVPTAVLSDRLTFRGEYPTMKTETPWRRT